MNIKDVAELLELFELDGIDFDSIEVYTVKLSSEKGGQEDENHSDD